MAAKRCELDCYPAKSQRAEFVKAYLGEVEYTAYDELIQLCDALSLPSGFCLIEKRLVDVVLRYGFNAYTLAKWRSYFTIQQKFEQEIGQSIYRLLPGIVENTFGAGFLEGGEGAWKLGKKTLLP